ncbi:hypothetical protein C8R43DRAFT_955694 [Mycena crocata]|nr:hypothetical protein C8R43DRAFT_955694 [Mycena crocata]
MYVLGSSSVFMEHFAPTRDMSDNGDCLFSYKTMAYETAPGDTTRGMLVTYLPSVFGQIDWIGDLDAESNRIVRLSIPEGVNCRMKAIYLNQLVALRQILDEELLLLGGTTDENWFRGEDLPKKHQCFYVYLDNAGDWDFDIEQGKGKLLGLWTTLLRRDKYKSEGELQRIYSLRSNFYEAVVMASDERITEECVQNDALNSWGITVFQLNCFGMVASMSHFIYSLDLDRFN